MAARVLTRHGHACVRAADGAHDGGQDGTVSGAAAAGKKKL
jgi:hypothetical protein